MAVVSPDQDSNPSLLTPVQAFKWFIDQGGKFNSGWENRVTRVIPRTEVPFTPLLTAPFITVPVLMMIGRDDEMPLISKEVQLEVYSRIESEKEFYEIDGGHFGAMEGPLAPPWGLLGARRWVSGCPSGFHMF